MKKLFTLCVVAFCCAWALSGCKDSNSDPEPNVPPVVTPNFNFELVGKTSGSITVRVTPENFDQNYFWAAIAEATLQEKYGNDPKAAAADVVAMLNRYSDYGYDSFEAFYANQVSSGISTDTYDGFNAQTSVVCLAFGLSETGVITTEIFLSPVFTTDAVSPSSNTFKISLIDKTIVRVEPSNDDTYTFYLFPKSTADAYGSLEKLAEAFINQNPMNLLTYSGVCQIDFYNTFTENAAGSYIAFAFGYESGCITTDIASETFEYEMADPSVGDPFANLTSDVSVECTAAYYEKALGNNQFSEQAFTYFLALQAESSFYGTETRLALYVQKENDSAFPESMAGTYQINASLAKESIVKGWKDANGWIHGSIYYEKDSYSANASIDSGTVTITDNGNGTYTVTVDAKDMNNHAIRANYTGAIPAYED